MIRAKDTKIEKSKCQGVVLAVGMRPEKSLYQELMGEPTLSYEIGDCKRPRQILDTVWEANLVASVV